MPHVTGRSFDWQAHAFAVCVEMPSGAVGRTLWSGDRVMLLRGLLAVSGGWAFVLDRFLPVERVSWLMNTTSSREVV